MDTQTSTRPEDRAPVEMPLVISADDHVVEPAGLWQARLPAHHRERGPRVVRRKVGMGNIAGGTFNFQIDDPDGQWGDVWLFEDAQIPLIRNLACAGFDREDMTLTPVTYEEMRPGCYDPVARMEDMALNGVEGSLCFPNNVVRFCGQTFAEAADKDLGLACVRAYNDWMVEEWSGSSSGRLIPLCIVPMWDPELAAAEVRRVAARGVRAVTFSEAPHHLGLPSVHSGAWEPFFAACAEAGVVICMHIGSSSRMPTTSVDAPPGVPAALTFVNAASALTDWLMSGIFIRHPDLSICLAECQIGWIPYLLERIDSTWSETRGYNEIYDKIPVPPSTYFSSNVYVTFFDDQHGLDAIDKIGVDRVLFETDYPHADGTWPRTPEVLRRLTRGLDAATVERIARVNVIEMLDLDWGGQGAPSPRPGAGARG